MHFSHWFISFILFILFIIFYLIIYSYIPLIYSFFLYFISVFFFSLIYFIYLFSGNFTIVGPFPQDVYPIEFSSVDVTCVASDSSGPSDPGGIEFMKYPNPLKPTENLYFTNRTETQGIYSHENLLKREQNNLIENKMGYKSQESLKYIK